MPTLTMLNKKKLNETENTLYEFSEPDSLSFNNSKNMKIIGRLKLLEIPSINI